MIDTVNVERPPRWWRQVVDGSRGDLRVFHRTYHAVRPRPVALVLFVAQPSSLALPLMRLSADAPKLLSLIARRVLMRRFGCDVEHGARIAPGLLLAHATGIVIGGEVRIGTGVKLHQHVTLGQSRGASPELAPGVAVYAGAVIVGGITVGERSRIGANAYVSADVPPGTTVAGGTRWPAAPTPSGRRSSDGAR